MSAKAKRKIRRRNQRRMLLSAIVLMVGFAGLKTYLDGRIAGEEPAPQDFVQRPVSFPFLRVTQAAVEPNSNIVARVGDLPITDADVRGAAADLGLDLPLSDDQRQQVLTKLASRIVLAQAAEDQGLNQDSLFVHAVQDHYLRALADAYAAQNIAIDDVVGEDEIDSYIADNPLLFAARKHYAFDSFDIDVTAFNAANRQQVAALASAAEMVAYFKRRQIAYLQTPFAFYSEQIPAEILSQLDDFEDGRKNFFVRGDGYVRIVRVIGVQSVPLDGQPARDLARVRLRAQRLQGLVDKESEKLVERLLNGKPLPLVIY